MWVIWEPNQPYTHRHTHTPSEINIPSYYSAFLHTSLLVRRFERSLVLDINAPNVFSNEWMWVFVCSSASEWVRISVAYLYGPKIYTLSVYWMGKQNGMPNKILWTHISFVMHETLIAHFIYAHIPTCSLFRLFIADATRGAGRIWIRFWGAFSSHKCVYSRYRPKWNVLTFNDLNVQFFFSRRKVHVPRNSTVRNILT